MKSYNKKQVGKIWLFVLTCKSGDLVLMCSFCFFQAEGPAAVEEEEESEKSESEVHDENDDEEESEEVGLVFLLS